MKQSIYIILFHLLSNTILVAQCFEPDASIWLDTWVSCETSSNPKSEYGESHWIQYDFGSIRTLSKSWVWNTNDPARLDQGFNQVKIDYSKDGQDWTYWGEMNFPKAEGKAVYGGFQGPDLMNIEARYILLTVISNHGDTNCTGIAEIKFNLLPGSSEGVVIPTCPTLTAVEEVTLEEITSTEVFLFWEYDLEGTSGIYFVFEYRELGGDWMEIETEDLEVFLDELAPGTQYEYRIVTECGEEIIYSEIRSFTTLPDEITDTEDVAINEDRLRLFPNPTRSIVVMQYRSNEGGNLDYFITNTQGKVLQRGSKMLSPGLNQVMIDSSILPPGVYFVNTKSRKAQNQSIAKFVRIP